MIALVARGLLAAASGEVSEVTSIGNAPPTVGEHFRRVKSA